MDAMLRRFLPGFVALLAFSVFVVPVASLRAQDDAAPAPNRWTRKYKAPPPSSRISVTVLKDDNGKPIENAAVIFHPVQGDKDKGSMELKSDEDGKAVIDVIPIGDTVRLQVFANGFQTYGADYKISKPEMSMEVRLKRPGAQYSIYTNHNTAAGNGSATDKNASPDKNAAPAQNGKSGNSGGSGSSQSGSQPGSQSGQNQNQSQSQKQNQAQNQ